MSRARPSTLVLVLVLVTVLSGLASLESCSGGLDGTSSSTAKKTTTGSTGTSGGSNTATSGASATTTGSANTTTGATATTTGSANTTTGATATTTGSANTTTGATATTTSATTTTTGATATTTSTTTGTTATTTGTSATTTSAATSSSTGTTGGSSTSTGSCTDTTPATPVKATMAALTNFSAPDTAGMIIGSGVDNYGGFGTSWPYKAPVGNTYVYPTADRDTSAPDGGAPTCALKAGATVPAHPLTSSLNVCDKVPTPGVFTIKGTVGDYSGAGFALWCPIDASMFSGIQFDIGGTFGPFTTITFTVTTATDTTLATTTTAQYTATVSSAVTTVSVPWTQFTSGDGGASGLNNKLITGIGWGLGWYYPADAGAPYAVNFTIDNVAWLP